MPSVLVPPTLAAVSFSSSHDDEDDDDADDANVASFQKVTLDRPKNPRAVLVKFNSGKLVPIADIDHDLLLRSNAWHKFKRTVPYKRAVVAHPAIFPPAFRQTDRHKYI